MSRLTLSSQAVAYDDLGASSNPSMKSIDWSRTMANIPVFNPSTQKQTIQPNGAASFFDSSRGTTIDGTSVFSIIVSPYDPTIYRITNTGGTAPGFALARSVNCTAIPLTIVANSNLTLTISAGSGTPFSTVQEGDTTFIPGTNTGDVAGPFNSLNTGFWNVISQTPTALILARASGSVFSGVSESVTPASVGQLLVFSANNIQVGDIVDISGGFSQAATHSYEVATVTPKWFEFQSTAPIGNQTGVIPDVFGLQFYILAKRWIRVEGDQEMAIQFNSDVSLNNRIEPLSPGDPSFVGFLEKLGTVWHMSVVNLSTSVLNVFVASAE